MAVGGFVGPKDDDRGEADVWMQGSEHKSWRGCGDDVCRNLAPNGILQVAPIIAPSRVIPGQEIRSGTLWQRPTPPDRYCTLERAQYA
jgi:hypothetical protein